MSKVVIDSLAWIPKEGLTLLQQEAIRNKLTIKPIKFAQYDKGEPNEPIRLYVDREDALGVPPSFFFQGNSLFQPEWQASEGDKNLWPGPIDFVGKLRSEQEELVGTTLSWLETQPGGIVQAVPGMGKCLGLGTKVLKYDGTLVNVEDISVGDQLMGPDSTPRNVTSVCRGVSQLYEVVPTKGDPWICNDAHILSLVNSITGEIEDINVEDWIRLRGRKKHHLKQFQPERGVTFSNNQNLSVDPYFLGLWVGDGTKLYKEGLGIVKVAITTKDKEVVAEINAQASKWNLQVREEWPLHLEHPCPTYHLHRGSESVSNNLLLALRNIVGDLDRLPKAYLTASRADRLAFLAGIIDSDGSLINEVFDIVQVRKKWVEDIAFLARSVGFKVTNSQKEINGKTYYRLRLSGYVPDLPTRLDRKKQKPRLQKKKANRTGISVRPVGIGPYAGFTIDGDHRFLLGDFTVTHNTVCSLAVIARMNVPTLVVVHKEFLVDQWKERITEFLPEAKVGTVKQDECDFEGKHVVIALVQSLAVRDYGPAFRSWPGLMVVDECHRISARTWSQVPLKYPCRWRLGLSATPRRKDGTEDVFRYTLGPVCYKSKEVRLTPQIKRIFTDFDLYAYKNANLSHLTDNMVLRFLCASKARNTLIVENLKKALVTGRKVIVLSKRIEHLKRLQRELLAGYEENAPTTGLLIGGLSKEEREHVAGVQCIFATFQLVSEALDIPALDTLFLVTPASDIEQAAGRILRPHPGKKDPIIVDFRDDKVAKLLSTGKSREKQYKNFGWMV